MRELLAGYYRPSDAEFADLWATCTFCFDANVLLNIYRSDLYTRDSLLAILRKGQDRIWLPHQAALEYHEGRVGVITKENDAYKTAREKIETGVLTCLLEFESAYARHPFIDTKMIGELIRTAVVTARKSLEELEANHPNYLASDPLRDSLTAIFKGKVGQAYCDDELKKLHGEAAGRYERKQPPGYRDAKKGSDRQYGDVVLWTQLIDYALKSKTPIIFVTDDRKDDWWYKHSGKTIGPLPELVQEFTAQAETQFYM